MLTVLDPSLRDTFSHHHVLNTHLCRRAAQAGIGFQVVAHQKAVAEARPFGYPVLPHFRRSIYEDIASVEGEAHAQQVLAHREDVISFWAQAAPGARLVVHSATAAFLQGLAQAWHSNPSALASLVVQLMFRPESMAADGADVTAAWARYGHALQALNLAAHQASARLTIATSCDEFALAFSECLCPNAAAEGVHMFPVEVHPQTMFSREERLLMRAHRRLLKHEVAGGLAEKQLLAPRRVLLFAGDPKLDKGLAWVIGSLKALLKLSRANSASSALQYFLHLGPNRFATAEIEALYAQVRALEAEHACLQVAWGHLSPTEWARMLSSMDAVLLPYDPAVYRHKTSGILGECLWRLRPDARLLVTAGSWMEREVRRWHLGFTPLPHGDTQALLSSLAQLESAPFLGEPATTEPSLWARHFGMGNDEWLVQKVLS